MPGKQLPMGMGTDDEEVVNAGILLAEEGLHPSSKGVRVARSGSSHQSWMDCLVKRTNWSSDSGSGKCARWKKPSNGSSAARLR